MRLGLLTAFTLVLILPLAVSARSFADLGVGDTSSFSISATPQYPAPRSQVTLSFLSSSLDLTNATLDVAANGKSVYKGSVRPVAVVLGGTGSITAITATMSFGGATYEQTLRIQPQDVVLVAEPVSSAPALYPGKPFVPLEGSVRIVAMADMKNAEGSPLVPATLSYSWTVDGTRIANSSGIGKATLMVAAPLQYRARDISVAVSSQDGSLAGGASVSLTAREPVVRIYEHDPLLGIRFTRALTGTYAIKSAESTLFAAPFSFPTTRGAPLLQWFLSGSAAQTGNSITLRPTGDGQGSASLSVVASSGDYTTATANLSLLFGDTPSTNLFGL